MIRMALFFVCVLAIMNAETLQDTLRAANIPTQQFSAPELEAHITSYAITKSDPFLLAYYVTDGSNYIRPPLYVIRYDRTTHGLRRSSLRDITAPFSDDLTINCLGSAMEIREHHGTIYIDTHYNPSAGCIIVLSSELVFKTALSGWLIGLLGSDYAILQRSEVHFMSVHPMRIGVFDVKRNQVVEVYPVKNDPYRRQFSRLLAPHVSEQWCIKNNAQCDPENFNTERIGKVMVNEADNSFTLEAQFSAAGFGDAAMNQVPPRIITYTFRNRNGKWEHHAFPR